MHNTKKRKHRNDIPNKRNHRQHNSDTVPSQQQQQHAKSDPDPSLFILAHEAELRRGPQARELAKSLEVLEYIRPSETGVSQVRDKIGSALIEWVGGSALPAGNSFDDDEEDTISLGTQITTVSRKLTEDKPRTWVDRYDARLLLDALPDFTSPPDTPESPSGWSDLPSDAEDTFFFTPGETEDYRNEKRRRLLDQVYEERVKARLEEDKAQDIIDDDPWGGSDEEPDDTQRELMRRTAAHLLSSPNPAQLEMRILANHGADKRFAFLRGRWSRSWQLTKAKLRVEKGKETEAKEKEHKGLGVLAGYDSDSEQGSDKESGGEQDKRELGEDEQDEEAKKEIRRQKAKEWAKLRRLATDVDET